MVTRGVLGFYVYAHLICTASVSGAATQLACDVSEPPRQHALLTRAELKRQERNALISALKQTNGKISGCSGAAELLGMKPSTFSSRMAALGLKREMLGLAN
jgi:transcriptional regulator with GAF, ATPase, and Fis domain